MWNGGLWGMLGCGHGIENVQNSCQGGARANEFLLAYEIFTQTHNCERVYLCAYVFVCVPTSAFDNELKE